MSEAKRINFRKEEKFLKEFDVHINLNEKSDEEIKEVIKLLENVDYKISSCWITDLIKIIEQRSN